MDELDYSEYVPKVHFELIPIKNLVSNQEYQRTLSMGHVKKAVDHFDLYQINPVKISRRNGINYVINGQHTIEIVATVSDSRETPVWCMVYDDLVYTEEADIFANQQKFVKSLLPYEIFMAYIEAGSDKHLIIKDLVESYHLQIVKAKSNCGICAVSALESIFFGMSDLYQFQVSCLAVFIGRIIGNVNLFSVIPVFIPFIQKCNALVSANAAHEIGDLGIAVYLHLFGKKRMIVCVVRIILSRIVLSNDGVCGKIKKKSAVRSD